MRRYLWNKYTWNRLRGCRSGSEAAIQDVNFRADPTEAENIPFPGMLTRPQNRVVGSDGDANNIRPRSLFGFFARSSKVRERQRRWKLSAIGIEDRESPTSWFSRHAR